MFNEEQFKIEQKYTIFYYDDLTGFDSLKFKLLSHEISNWAQHKALWINFIAYKKRKATRTHFLLNHEVLIVKGYHDISFNDFYEVKDGKSCTVTRAKISRYSPNWINHVLNQVNSNDIILKNF